MAGYRGRAAVKPARVNGLDPGGAGGKHISPPADIIVPTLIGHLVPCMGGKRLEFLHRDAAQPGQETRPWDVHHHIVFILEAAAHAEHDMPALLHIRLEIPGRGLADKDGIGRQDQFVPGQILLRPDEVGRHPQIAQRIVHLPLELDAIGVGVLPVGLEGPEVVVAVQNGDLCPYGGGGELPAEGLELPRQTLDFPVCPPGRAVMPEDPVGVLLLPPPIGTPAVKEHAVGASGDIVICPGAHQPGRDGQIIIGAVEIPVFLFD